jgi:hypothetical protein
MKMPLDLHRINMGTWSMQESYESRVKGLAGYQLDHHKKNRRNSQQCKVCYYLRGPVVAGQAFTSHPCKNTDCDEETHSSCTDVPDFCTACAEKYGICRRCGGDQEGKERKSLKPPKRQPDPPDFHEVRLRCLGEGIGALRQLKLPMTEFQENLDALLKKYGVTT